MKIKSASNILLLAVLTMAFPTIGSASNCSGVKFNFNNSRDAKIKIDEVMIKGNGKNWVQDINNKVVFAGESYTTDKLRFDKLKSGASGTFKVKYKKFNAASGRWSDNKIHEAKTVRCDNNMTIRFIFE